MKAIAAMLLAIYVSSATAQAPGIDPVRSRNETYVLEGLGGLAALGVGAALGAGVACGIG